MRLIKLYIENFGKLNNFDYNFTSGINQIFMNNGWGKSTFLMFIKVMFYGFDNSGKRDNYNNDKLRFKPWQGGIYGGNLTFEINDKIYTIFRTFSDKDKDDFFELRDMYNLVSYEYSSNIGEELFNIDSTSFFNTLFIYENNCGSESTSEIDALIGNVMYDENDVNKFDKCMSSLNDKINRLSPTRKTGQLFKMKEHISQVKTSLLDMPSVMESMSRTQREIKNLKERIKSTDIKLKSLSNEISNDNSHVNVVSNERINYLNNIIEQQQLRHKELNESKKNKFILIPFILYFIIALIILFKIYLDNQGRTVVFIFLSFTAAVSVIFIIFNHIKISSCNKRNDAAIKTLEKEMDKNYKELDILMSKKMKKISDNEEQRKLSFTHNFDRMLKDRQDCEHEIAELSKKLEFLQSRYDELIFTKNELDDYMEKYNELSGEYKIAVLTSEYLIKARNTFLSKYSEPIQKSFTKYYKMCCKPDTEMDFRTDIHNNFLFYQDGMQHNIKFLSKGIKDLCYICARLSYIEAMYKEDTPFIIMDDPLCGMDDDTVKRAQNLIEHASHKYQIIYCTCHESRSFKLS